MQELVNCSRERKGLMTKMVSGSCVGVRQDSGKKEMLRMGNRQEEGQGLELVMLGPLV